MLNPLPELLPFALLAPSLIRIFLGGYYLWASMRWLKKLYFKKPELTTDSEQPVSAPKQYGIKNHILTWILVFGSVSVLAGFLTQIGALILFLVSFYFLYEKREERLWYGALCVMAISLLFSGAGFFAFDLPL